MGVESEAERVAAAAWATTESVDTHRARLGAELHVVAAELLSLKVRLKALQPYYPELSEGMLEHSFPTIAVRAKYLRHREGVLIQWLALEYRGDEEGLLAVLDRAYALGGTG